MGWPASRHSRAFAPGHEGCLHVAWGMFAPGRGGMSVLQMVDSYVHWLDVLSSLGS